jgi:hypothetical protein
LEGKVEIERKIIEQTSNFCYLAYLLSNDDNISIGLQKCIKMNGIIEGQFGKHMTTETKLRIHKITSKGAVLWQ